MSGTALFLRLGKLAICIRIAGPGVGKDGGLGAFGEGLRHEVGAVGAGLALATRVGAGLEAGEEASGLGAAVGGHDRLAAMNAAVVAEGAIAVQGSHRIQYLPAVKTRSRAIYP